MPVGCPDSGARVYLAADGQVTLNGQHVEASQLRDALRALNPRLTVIC